jgi:two-component system NtrC family response regulator
MISPVVRTTELTKKKRSSILRLRITMNKKIRLLFVDDEKDFLDYMTKRLLRHDLDVVSYDHPVTALEKTEGQTFDVGLLDLNMPDMKGEELLRRLKERDPSIEIIILTGHGSIASAFETSKEGAYEYLLKPCDFDALVQSICNAYAKRIKALHKDQSEKVDGLMTRMLSKSPLDLLRALKKVQDGVSSSMAASALAEGGDFDSAREVVDAKDPKKKKKKDKS